MTPEQQALASNFARALAESGVAPKAIAEARDITEQAVSNWKRTGKIAREHLPTIAQLTGWSVERLLGTAHEDPQPEFAGLAKIARRVPVVGTAKMGDNGYFEDFSWIPGAGDGHIEIQTQDPNAYCLRVRGMSMHPAIRDGWYVLIEPNGQPREGEYVLLKLRNGKKMVKELLFRRSGSIQVMSVNGEERFTVELEDLEDMQPVGAVVSPSKWTPD
ncbi:phage repressor protein C with HTH and peptisase S24 domain [Variovorax paradoxus]|uniref:LexA family transcriptional regulator n=1 Tax=Variovorax paradoxus TaxID=34073 RepID=UPI00278B5889|nr:LexA family transcriptional regulator [Variovorax paradoxus]MDP9965107.1 phage repressor protein C with HTH and peptisase S24 domain [Variovorax paradoxus]